MARYAYDVNKTQRYIDVHKQFQGGLKTVDTDDSLGAVFLRDANNVSLSEFGFIEKRYGTYENFKAGLTVTENSFLQGYWEFLNKYIIIAIDGRLYYQSINSPESTFTEFTQFHIKEDLSYPNGLAAHIGLDSDFSVGSGFTGFQNTKLMGAVNLANVLYIFTGKYPVYILEEDGVLKAYLFAKNDPTYAELVVTGHNLLENDYDDLYYGENLDLEPITFTRTEDNFAIKDDTFYPKIPYAKDGQLNFNFSYDSAPEIIEPFTFDTGTQPESILNTVTLKDVKYRPSGPGASDLSFQSIGVSNYNFNILNNIPETVLENVEVISPPITWDNQQSSQITTSSLTTTEGTSFTAKQQYWGISDEISVPDKAANDAKRILELKEDGNDLFSINHKEVELEIDLIPNEAFTPGEKMAFAITTGAGVPVNFEDKLSQARLSLSSYSLNDTRTSYYTTDVFIRRYTGGLSDLIYYNLYYVNSGTFVPIYSYSNSLPSNTPDIGNAKIEYTLLPPLYNQISVQIYDLSGALYHTETLKYKVNTQEESLFNYNLRRAFPLSNSERTAFSNVLSKVNRQTKLELYADGVLQKTYSVGSELLFENNFYKFVLPIDLPEASYKLLFKTVDVDTTDFSAQSVYLNQEFSETKFFTNFIDDVLRSAPSKFFLPNFSQFIEVQASDYLDFLNRYWYLYSISGTISLQSEDEIGSSFLKVSIEKGLLSGTYDFQFDYELTQEEINYTNNQRVSISDPFEFSYIVKDVTITEEKLDDYTFFQGDRAHPIWSCNNVIEHFGKLMVWGSDEMPTALFYSFPDRPFYFPSFFYLDFTNEDNQPLVNVTPFMNILVAQTEDRTWGIRGNSGLVDAPSPYVEFSINNTVGTIAPKSVRPVRNHLFFLSKQGVIALKSLYAADEQYNIDFVDRNVRNIVPQDSEAVGIQYDNQYWLNFPEQRITLRWYIDKKAWVQDTYSVWNNFRGVFKYQIKNGKLEFITKPSDFDSGEFIYKIGVDYSLPYDLGKTYNASFETSFLNQNYPFHHKNYKEFKYDFTIQNEYNPSREPLFKTEELIINGESSHTFTQLNLEKNHKYLLSFDSELPIESAQLGEQTITITGVSLNTDTELITDYEFMVDNDITDLDNLTIFFASAVNYGGPAALSDITYSESLQFLTKLISEENNVLNQEEEVGYEQQDSVISVDLEDFKGFTLGESSFGDRVTLIKTVKLSGRGYNLKAYFEDFSNSKWTIESMGITYKMKKARSR